MNMIIFEKSRQENILCNMIEYIVKLSDCNDESEVYSSIFNNIIIFDREFIISPESILIEL